MTRKILAIAAAVAALSAYGSAAQACISCEYTPEVLKAGESRQAPVRAERGYSEEKSERRSRAAKKSSTRDEKPERKEAKSEPKEAKAAVIAPEKHEASSEHSAITTTGAAIANQVKAAVTAPQKAGPQSENSTISTATTATGGKPIETKSVEQATADKNVGCKKYFPSTGLTLTVPCE